MKRLALFLCFLFLTLNAFETEEPIGYEPDPLDGSFNSLDILSGTPNAIVHDCVNVMTGDFIHFSTDLSLPGAESVQLARFYSSSDPNLDTNPMHTLKLNHDKAIYRTSKHRANLVLRDSYGAMLPFQRSKANKNEYYVHPETFKKRVTNHSKRMSGRSYLKNRKLVAPASELRMTASDGEGNRYTFEKLGKKASAPLLQERKANGNLIQYVYNHSNLKKVALSNKSGQSFGQLEFMTQPMRGMKKDVLQVHGEGGSLVRYELSFVPYKGKSKWILQKVQPWEKPEENYTYDAHFERIIAKQAAKDLLRIDYYQEGHNEVWPRRDYFVKKVRAGRVMRLLSPVGSDSTLIPIYRFLYYLDAHKEKGGPLCLYGGRTEVYDALDHKIDYFFGSDERLSKIEYFKGTDPYQLHSLQRFFWGEPNTPNAGNLQAEAFLCQGQGVFCRTFGYDEHGNVLSECLHGHLSGECQTSLTIDEAGNPHGGECLYVGKEYTKEGRNLLAYENHSEYPHDCRYEYYEGTNQLKAKYTIDGVLVRKREFYEYDNSGALTFYRIDDGSSLDRNDPTGVGECRITRIKNTNGFPLGLPLIVEEKYLDKTGQELLLKKWVNSYNAQGKLCKKEIYDNQGHKAYTLTWKYNKLGLVIEETNALGQTLFYQYDENGNKTFEQGVNPNVSHTFEYDHAQRLIREVENGTDGTCLTKSYDYDYLGNRISSTDIYGHKTHYTYNEFSQIIKIIYPPHLDESGKESQSCEQKEYDALGNVTCLIDGKGAKTAKKNKIHDFQELPKTLRKTLIGWKQRTQMQEKKVIVNLKIEKQANPYDSTRAIQVNRDIGHMIITIFTILKEKIDLMNI
jgi:YD repeat-containing protein